MNAGIVLAVIIAFGIVVGFTCQDLFKNILGGLMIILDRPFHIGDRITVGDYSGKVSRIGLWSTCLIALDHSVIRLPNSKIIEGTIRNINGGKREGPASVEIYLPAGVDIEQTKRIAYKAAISSRYVYLKKPVSVTVKSELHGRSSAIKFCIRAYVLDTRYELPFQSDITGQMMDKCND
jgi:small-conductance mechanosensitive channel